MQAYSDDDEDKDEDEGHVSVNDDTSSDEEETEDEVRPSHMIFATVYLRWLLPWYHMASLASFGFDPHLLSAGCMSGGCCCCTLASARLCEAAKCIERSDMETRVGNGNSDQCTFNCCETTKCS